MLSLDEVVSEILSLITCMIDVKTIIQYILKMLNVSQTYSVITYFF